MSQPNDMIHAPNVSIPENARVINYLRREGKPVPLVAAPDSAADPYYSLGSHPDVVARVWDQLSRGLPKHSRWIVCGTPGLVQAETGLILAFACGTQYCLRVPDSAQDEALKAGLKTSSRWSTGETMETKQALGSEWFFGAWLRLEEQWLTDL